MKPLRLILAPKASLNVHIRWTGHSGQGGQRPWAGGLGVVIVLVIAISIAVAIAIAIVMGWEVLAGGLGVVMVIVIAIGSNSSGSSSSSSSSNERVPDDCASACSNGLAEG